MQQSWSSKREPQDVPRVWTWSTWVTLFLQLSDSNGPTFTSCCSAVWGRSHCLCFLSRLDFSFFTLSLSCLTYNKSNIISAGMELSIYLSPVGDNIFQGLVLWSPFLLFASLHFQFMTFWLTAWYFFTPRQFQLLCPFQTACCIAVKASHFDFNICKYFVCSTLSLQILHFCLFLSGPWLNFVLNMCNKWYQISKNC